MEVGSDTQNENVLIYSGTEPLSKNGKTLSWTTEKTAIQWLRRKAEEEKAKYEIIKPSGKVLLIDFSEQIIFTYGKHQWRKSNVMAIADGQGQYDKLVCVHCGKIVKRYRNKLHFREELEICEKNIIKV